MNQFWAQFLPDVAATMIGVVFGVPVALWIARHGRSVEESQGRSAANTRLRTGLEALLTGIAHNRTSLHNLAATVGRNRVLFDIPLDTVTWDAVRDTVAPLLQRPDLQRKVAFHFVRLQSVARLTAVHGDLLADSQSANNILIDDVRRHLTDEVRQLVEDGDQLAAALRKALQEL